MLHGISTSSTLVYLAAVLSLFVLPATAAPPRRRLPQIKLVQLERAFAGHCPNQTIGEVVSCGEALPYINDAIGRLFSLSRYGLKTRGQRAAYVSNMAYEGAYLKYNRNLVNPSQGTRSIMPAVSLKAFVDADSNVQLLWPTYPSLNESAIVDVLIENKADFLPGAWWTVAGPGCSDVAARLSKSEKSFVDWEKGCINGGPETIPARLAIYKTVYHSIR
ncbi:hypothetical protein BGZ70_000182 [Mortierella alpina]|uniref:Uncharacterized protein n=1 Tax=Mortierella alpina TaxID=64518 RepID=A0A9P6JCL5_MORAP|nr:hypothetical protein BGZ70_000182 [Mortierella alpina]